MLGLSSDKTLARKAHKSSLAKRQMSLVRGLHGQLEKEQKSLKRERLRSQGPAQEWVQAGFHWAGRMSASLVSVIIPEFICATALLEGDEG